MSVVVGMIAGMSSPSVALATPPIHVLKALGTGRWTLSWSDTVTRHRKGQRSVVVRYRWMLVSNRAALLIEGDQHGLRQDHSTLAVDDQVHTTVMLYADAELDAAIADYQ